MYRRSVGISLIRHVAAGATTQLGSSASNHRLLLWAYGYRHPDSYTWMPELLTDFLWAVQFVASNTAIPARAHSSSCSLVGAPQTPHAPSRASPWIMGRPPRRPSGVTILPPAAPYRRVAIRRSANSSLGRPITAAAIAFPMDPRSTSHLAPSIRFNAIRRPSTSQTAMLMSTRSSRALAIPPSMIRLASERVSIGSSIL